LYCEKKIILLDAAIGAHYFALLKNLQSLLQEARTLKLAMLRLVDFTNGIALILTDFGFIQGGPVSN